MIDLGKVAQLVEGLRTVVAALPGLQALNVAVVTIQEVEDIAACVAVKKVGVYFSEGSWEEKTTIGSFVREPVTLDFGLVIVVDDAGPAEDGTRDAGGVQSILGIILGPPAGDPADVDPLLRGIRGENIGAALADQIFVYGVKFHMLKRPDNTPPGASGPRAAVLVLRTTEFAL